MEVATQAATHPWRTLARPAEALRGRAAARGWSAPGPVMAMPG